MKTIKLFIVAGMILFSNNFYGQLSEHKNFPTQLSFVYPIGTSWVQSTDYQFNFSLNALTGNTGGVIGCEIGGLMNMNAGDVTGLQVGGIYNMTNGNVTGLQIGGILSLCKDVKGAQINGIFSKSNEVTGFQLSGIGNLANGNFTGMQLGGISNLTDSVTGMQLSGIFNNASDVKGVQLTGIFNHAKSLKGVQIGLINIADSVESGAAIGLISFSLKNFYNEWEISFADYMNVGVSYRLGTKQFYNIYSVGYNFMKDNLWVTGFGFGHIHDINDNLAFRPEIVGYGYFPNDWYAIVRDTYAAHIKLGLVYRITEHIALSLAPEIYGSLKSNRGFLDTYGYEQSPIHSFTEYKPFYSNSLLEMGLGASFGINIK